MATARWAGWMLAGAMMLGAVGMAARGQGPVQAHDDPTGDAKALPDLDDALDLRRWSLERKAAGRLEIVYETAHPLPRTPKQKALLVTYADVDQSADTGRKYGDIGVDLIVTVVREPGEMQWRVLVDPTSPVTFGETFTVAKLSVTRDRVEIALSSPLFKRLASWRFYAETLWGDDLVDRIPNEGFLSW